MRKQACRAILVGVFALLILVPSFSVWGDCGSIPYRSIVAVPRMLTLIEDEGGVLDIKFDPLKVMVYEPGQRGIILWNGEEEILLLSTEIRTSEPVSILEVIPFLSEPTVRLGSFETFEAMQRLLIEKSMWTVASGGGVPGVDPVPDAAKITFYERMGAHDLTVVQVKNKDFFVEWVVRFLAERGATEAMIEPEFLEVIARYLDRGAQWFVFDSIDASDKLQSREPVEYRFKSDSVYYPLEISTRENGKTTVDLLLVTKQPVQTFDELQFAVRQEKGVALKHDELQKVSDAWANFMGTPELALQRVRILGDIRDLNSDFIVR